MALVTCRECKKEVSSTATSCPNCGVADPWMSEKEVEEAEMPFIWQLIFRSLAVLIGIWFIVKIFS